MKKIVRMGTNKPDIGPVAPVALFLVIKKPNQTKQNNNSFWKLKSAVSL